MLAAQWCTQWRKNEPVEAQKCATERRFVSLSFARPQATTLRRALVATVMPATGAIELHQIERKQQ
ncbi:hypothetical protein [Pseudomonas mosselii]|uniref:hypothetical protein n=1 Tax=Pseudomonas mosselii TaxID=78327 RepID=UPI001BD471EC|nr:hypothetical protein [Pseudomonas mosselii]MBS9760461.1 hypothetical protein [Pseudomonas mosselii]